MRNEPTGMEGVYPAEPGAARTGQLRQPDKPNLITVGWTGTICTQPPMLSISVRPERYSHHLIQESGEFVVNLPTESLVRAIDWCGVKSGRDVDKFAAMHLTAVPAAKVGTVLVEESP